MNTATRNFARAVRTVIANSATTHHGLVEATGLKQSFPRTDAKLFLRNLKCAAKHGLLTVLDDGNCVWVR